MVDPSSALRESPREEELRREGTFSPPFSIQLAFAVPEIRNRSLSESTLEKQEDYDNIFGRRLCVLSTSTTARRFAFSSNGHPPTCYKGLLYAHDIPSPQ